VDSENDILSRVAEMVSGAKNILVLTGAGMSAESGVPTFREAQTGLWEKYDPQQLATPEAFERNPSRVFGWYHKRLSMVRAAQPHRGYRALVRVVELVLGKTKIVTQNVDGLHRRSGSEGVIELHGSLDAFRCTGGSHDFPSDEVLSLIPDAVTGNLDPPKCRICTSPVRPGVVWFNEMLPEAALREAWRTAEAADLALVIGTSALVHPAAGLPSVAARRGGSIVEINPERTPVSSIADVVWNSTAGEALSSLVERLESAHR